MSGIDNLPPLRDVIARHGIAATKKLGQNFLLDLNVTMKIARACGPLENVCVLEVGPGPGGLTRALLASGAKKVVAIERDERCLSALAEIADAWPGRLYVIHGDALEVDHHAVLVETGIDPSVETVRIAANLPYNIATPLLTNWLEPEHWPPFWAGMTLMFQKEVAERICATPEDKAWGRLGVLSDWRCHSEIAFDLPPSTFSPPPKVTSSVVLLEPKASPLPADAGDLRRVVQAAFGQRRKMLRQSLKALGGEELLAEAGIEGKRRAETLSTAEFVALANALTT